MDQRIDTASRAEGAPRGFLQYVGILAQWRKFLLINLMVVFLLSVGVSYLLPVWYRASASILPPKEQDFLNPLAAAGSVLKGLSLGRRIGGASLGAYNYLAILKSRSVQESVVRKFNLIDVYDVGDSSMEKAIKELKDNAAFEVQDDDYITIEVLDRDPRRAADMANFFVAILNERSIELGTQEARNNREFVEKRLEKTKQDLRNAEDAVRAYQEKTKMIISPDASSSGVSSVAEMFGLKAKKEVELEILKKTLNADNSRVLQLELELKELDKKLATFPEIGLESVRLYRDAMIQQKIMEYLVPLYEQAKVDERKDVPVLLVLDKAVAPEKKVKPQRMLIVLSVSFIALVLLIPMIFAMHGVFLRNDGATPFERSLRSIVVRIAAAYRVKIAG